MSNRSECSLQVAGECGLVVEFGTEILPEINSLVQQLSRLLADHPYDGVIEFVPTYRSVTIYFDPLRISRHTLENNVRRLLAAIDPRKMEKPPVRLVHVPVCYGGVLGPDLEFVAKYTGLSVREVISLHVGQPYLVYMLGFTPGFPYLGGLPERLCVPRQEKPREKVPAGSVGIGGNQTGFYPIESSGEWWLIGRTPLQAFNPRSSTPFLVTAGDYVQFVEVSIDEYFTISRDVRAGTYMLEVSRYGGPGV